MSMFAIVCSVVFLLWLFLRRRVRVRVCMRVGRVFACSRACVCMCVCVCVCVCVKEITVKVALFVPKVKVLISEPKIPSMIELSEE